MKSEADHLPAARLEELNRALDEYILRDSVPEAADQAALGGRFWEFVCFFLRWCLGCLFLLLFIGLIWSFVLFFVLFCWFFKVVS